MKTKSTFLTSRLARRILWLFILSALIPMTALAVISLRNVTAQLQEQTRLLLHQVSRDEAMSIIERMRFLEADLELAATSIRDVPGKSPAHFLAGSSGPNSNLQNRFTGLRLVTPDGNCQSFIGACESRIEFTAAEQESLKSGKAVFSAIECKRSTPCIFVSRELEPGHPYQGILAADIQDSYFWGAETLRTDIDLCVLDQSGRSLFCSAESPSAFPAQGARSNSEEFEWQRNGQEYLANFWNFPLTPSLSAAHWTVVASQNKSQALAPLARFRTSFLLVFLLALWMVLLLSLVQIRRNLDPLVKLMEGTRRISQGNYQTKVEVKSRDEFGQLAESFNSMTGRIEKHMTSLKVINEIDRAILSSWDIEKIVDALFRRIGELIPCDLVGVTLLDTPGPFPLLINIYGPGSNSRSQTEKFEVTPEQIQELVDKGQISVLGGSSDLPSYLKPLLARGMAYFLRVTILLEGRATAVFILGHASAPIWTEEDKDHGRQLADQFAVAQANSRLIGELQQLHWGTMTALARAIDAKSPWTMGHSERVTDLAIKIAKTMGLSPKELDIIRRGGLLHDIGKIGTPAEILDKPGRLTDGELKEMREHVNIGARILEPIPGLADSMPIVVQHHEWINGGGYPKGLAGEEVSFHARIFAVADCYDALGSDRPYRAGLPIKKIMQILQEGSGKQFDPNVLEVFRTMIEPEMKKQEREDAQETGMEVSLLRD
jgi:putative nucleotidyltransferase with HDIG domain